MTSGAASLAVGGWPNRLPQAGGARTAARTIYLAACTALFLAPALIALAQGAWQSEAGSLAPVVLALGGWTLWRGVHDNRALAAHGWLALWAPAMVVATALSAFASAIDMVALQAFAAWLGCVASFYALFGGAMVRKCAFPLVFLALVIPLPYALTMELNASLRGWLAENAVETASLLGLDVALEHGTIAVNQYVLAVENACAGANSTLSLVAIGLLYSYWVLRGGWTRMAVVALCALPIALCANIARVVVLMALVAGFGSAVLDTALHPLSGLVSFSIALGLLALVSRGAGAVLARYGR